jgi:hypothetical protein
MRDGDSSEATDCEQLLQSEGVKEPDRRSGVKGRAHICLVEVENAGSRLGDDNNKLFKIWAGRKETESLVCFSTYPMDLYRTDVLSEKLAG